MTAVIDVQNGYYTVAIINEQYQTLSLVVLDNANLVLLMRWLHVKQIKTGDTVNEQQRKIIKQLFS